ncbi:hypothetical protein V8E55_005252 [Tylopilus felleus]
MQALGPTEVQDLLNVTAQSIARHCGLANDPSNPDTRSEERRITDLRRQLGLLYSLSRPQAELAIIRSNKHICSPYFVRFQSTPAASDLVVLQATRIANEMDDHSDQEVVGEVCQFLSTLLVLQGTTEIPEDVKEKLIPKLDAWRRRHEGKFPAETSDRCYQSLKGTSEMTILSRMMKDQLEMPLRHCGFRGCDRKVDSVGPELKRCSRCKSAVYCGATHQKQHWAEHKKLCYPTTF